MRDGDSEPDLEVERERDLESNKRNIVSERNGARVRSYAICNHFYLFLLTGEPERERERDLDLERDLERERDTERDPDRDRDRDPERERDRERERDPERDLAFLPPSETR